MPHRSVRWLLGARAQANCLDRPADEAGPGGVADVVRRTAGLQAQSWRGAAMAVRARSTATTWADVDTAREVDRSILRGWFMRGTLQLVATEDAGPLLALLGPRLIAATERRYAELGLDAATRARAADVLEAYLVDHGPAGRAEIGATLVTEGLLAEPKGQAVYALIRHAGLLGRICYGPGYDSSETWVAVTDWLRAPLDLPSSAESELMEELARRYLAAYGPATAADFATWAGVPVPTARKAVEAVATVQIAVDGRPLYATADLTGTEDLRLLGEFDAYLLGYRDRQLVVDEAHSKRIHPGGGMLRPAIVLGGRVVGTWSHDRTAGATGLEFFEKAVDVSAEVADIVRFQS
jgi:hypothetical protein